MADSEVTARASLRRVFANPGLRRIQLAFFGSLLGDWAYGTAVTVWAYTEGGAAAVGVFAGVRFLASAVAGPLGALLADKVPRRTFMMATNLVRAALVAVAAVAVGLGAPALLVYVLAVVSGMVGAPFRSAQAGLIPKLVSAPDELTASNAVAANLENVVVFAGPALGAVLVGVFDVQVAFWFNVVTFLWSFALVAAVRVPDDAAPPETEPATEEATPPGFVKEVTAGFSVLARDGDLRGVAMLAVGQGLIWGALNVFLVIVSVTMLHAGAAGVGYLNAIMGGGTVLGGIVVLGRITKGRLGLDMAVGVLGWSLPLLLLAVFPSPVTAVLALAVIGVLDPFVNLGLETIPQRLAPDRVLSRVYAAVESALIAAMALGAFLAPLLIRLTGFREAMAIFGAVVALHAVTTLRRMRRLDARLGEPATLPVLRALPLFAPLPPPVLEALARKLVPVSVRAGEAVVAEGEVSDRFYVIRTGSVQVTQDGRMLRVEQPGDFFGEIGLLRDVPRTATVTAVSDTELLALDRDDFLAAVSGVQEARFAAEEVVSRRLAV